MKSTNHDWDKDPTLRQIADEIHGLEQAMWTCALRFTGHEYVERKYPKSGFPEIIKPVVSQRLFHDDDLDNLAAFFGLQRYLGKWGGDSLTPWSEHHIAYRLLFLHCYRLNIPSIWADQQYDRLWKSEFEPDRERIAAAVRRSLKTPGNGPLDWHEVPSA